ncbi:MAG: bifunctional nuclease family protein [Acidimicrobiales bacterium]|nr:bifunctional nuclease family protein [Acidimicrobiales bacterium]HLV90579.1 bifunctional nuclease family protein [Acidimicrobiia bacterium]
MVPLRVVDVRLELPSNQPIVLLKELDGDRYLPIWIGAPEATSIATALEKVTTPRPLTHDLLRSVIDVLGAVASRVVITEMRDSIFFADITFDAQGKEVAVSSRPSDAIALAVRTGTPIFASPAVLDEAAVIIEEEVDQEEELARFREFLSDVTVEDFLGGEGDD